MTRISRDEYFLKIAETTALRSTCPRAMVGAVLVKDNRIVSTGYNGAPRGIKHCDDEEGGCIMDEENHCIYAVHAEANCLIQGEIGDTIYTSHGLCLECAKLVINAGVKRIVYRTEYEDNRGNPQSLLADSGIIFEQYLYSWESS